MLHRETRKSLTREILNAKFKITSKSALEKPNLKIAWEHNECYKRLQSEILRKYNDDDMEWLEESSPVAVIGLGFYYTNVETVILIKLHSSVII